MNIQNKKDELEGEDVITRKNALLVEQEIRKSKEKRLKVLVKYKEQTKNHKNLRL